MNSSLTILSMSGHAVANVFTPTRGTARPEISWNIMEYHELKYHELLVNNYHEISLTPL